MDDDLCIYQLAVPRDNEYTPEAAASLFSSLAHLRATPWYKKLLGEEFVRLSLETMVVGQKIHFFATMNSPLASYWQSQFQAAYPLGIVAPQSDYLHSWHDVDLHIGQLVQTKPFYYPLKTYTEFSDIDPMTLVLGVLSQAQVDDAICLQYVIAGPPANWQAKPLQLIQQGLPQKDGTTQEIPGKTLINQKITENNFRTTLRIASRRPEHLQSIASALGSLNRGDGNALRLRRPWLHQRYLWRQAFFNRTLQGSPKTQILAASELATLWHMPNQTVKTQNLTWAKNLETEAPDNLPVHNFMSEDEQQDTNFFAKTNFRGEDMVFGIKREDRTRHMYVIGKSGVGKSTLLENMAIGDMKKGEGMAFLDPHGSSSEHLLNYIPKRRINDVIYFDPSDTQHPIPLNVLEVKDPEHREFVASGIVSIFNKLYGHSWGPRLEYVLRNTLLTLTEVPDATLPNIVDILTDANFRTHAVGQIKDPVMQKFWHDEFNKWDQKQQTEAIAPILNKVGQFVSSPLIRRIISPSTSKLDLEQIMNDGKILIVNLSQGKLGEDNAALMGAMIITKIQLSAMRRAHHPHRQWRDFYLYVDEFQNFATSSFIKILSEARKYRLSLILANQYVDQIDQEVMSAIIGNAGSMVNFLVGATDAEKLQKEYAEVFSTHDLTQLGRGEAIVKLAIDGLSSRPFFAQTLPPAASSNQNRDKVIRISRERWSVKA